MNISRPLLLGTLLLSLAACETTDDGKNNDPDNGQITNPDAGSGVDIDTAGLEAGQGGLGGNGTTYDNGSNPNWQANDGGLSGIGDGDFNTNSARPPFADHTINFDFNSSNVGAENLERIKAHARYLRASPHLTLRLEGHADERGSREYNIALGQQRAVAVKRILSYEGVSRDRIRTLSFGEEKPLDLRHNENAWYANRRVEFVYSD